MTEQSEVGEDAEGRPGADDSFCLEFLIRRRPVSLQTKNRKNLQQWKNFVRGEALKAWADRPVQDSQNVHLTVVYLCDEAPVDTDNIIKPIQDALTGIVVSDDLLVTDVEGHRRFFTDTFDLTRLPPLLVTGLVAQEECVYVSLREAQPLEDYL